MLSLFLVAVVFSANQGSVVQLIFPREAGVKSVQVVWEGKKIPMYRAGEDWITIVGVDLDTKPGDHKTDVLFVMEDGRIVGEESGSAAHLPGLIVGGGFRRREERGMCSCLRRQLTRAALYSWLHEGRLASSCTAIRQRGRLVL